MSLVFAQQGGYIPFGQLFLALKQHWVYAG